MSDTPELGADILRRSPHYTLRQLEYFIAVADSGSVTGAAAAVHLSQSAMSTALADLERTLGVQLVIRHHARGITLTEAGEQVLAEARRLLGHAQDLQSLAAHLGGDVTGQLRLGCFTILAPYVLPELLSAAADELPGLEIETTEEPLDRLAAGLHSGRFELALGYDLTIDDDIESTLLFTVAPHVVLPADHALAARKRISLTALTKEPLVLLDLPHSRDYFARLYAAAGVTPDIRYRTQSAELARALVARGLGYAVLNLRPHAELSLEGLPYVVVPLHVPLPKTESDLRVVLMSVAGARPTRRSQAVVELASRVLPASMKPNQSGK
ncbi:MAG: LysR substrate-binding domain-containing protein [Actinomycetes bacterium]